MKRVAIVLSGCGYKDGSEITETICLILQLSQVKAQMRFFAPNKVVDARNLMTESSRITRQDVEDLKNLKASEFDALAFPGGYGVTRHLSDWAEKGARGEALPEVKNAILDFHAQSKPIAAICISPILIALSFKERVTLTVGSDAETIQEIQKTGAIHEECPVHDYVTDREYKVLTTPAYMYDEATPSQIFQGISGLVKEFIEMA